MPTKSSTRASLPLSAPVHSAKALKVLAGARATFLAHGFSAATTDMIQQAAGVSKSTVYAHYPNKEALFAAVIQAECERVLAQVRERRFQGATLAEVLQAMATAYLDIVLSPDGLALYRTVVAEAPRFPELGRIFYLAGPGAMNGIAAEALATAEARGQLELGGIGHAAAAALFVNMVRGEAQMQSLTHPATPAPAPQRDLWAKGAVQAFLRAFGKIAR